MHSWLKKFSIYQNKRFSRCFIFKKFWSLYKNICKQVLIWFSLFVSGGIFDEDDGGSYSASELAFNMAINDVNTDGSILSGVTLKGITNTTRSLDIQQSVESGMFTTRFQNTTQTLSQTGSKKMFLIMLE